MYHLLAKRLVQTSHKLLQITKRRIHNSRGSAFLELALLTPVLLAVSLGTFELARVQNIQQRMSYVSSEIARSAFELCNTAINKQSCIDNLLLTINTNAQNALPGVEVVVSMYKYNQPLSSPSNQDYILLEGITGVDMHSGLPSSGRTPSGNLSSYTPPLDPGGTGNPNPMSDFYVHIPPLGNTIWPPTFPPVPNFPITSIQPKNTIITITEVYFQYTPSVVAQLLYFTPFSKNLYEHTIL